MVKVEGCCFFVVEVVEVEGLARVSQLMSLVAGHFCKRLVKLVRDRLELLLLVHQFICKARMSLIAEDAVLWMRECDDVMLNVHCECGVRQSETHFLVAVEVHPVGYEPSLKKANIMVVYFCQSQREYGTVHIEGPWP